ncbi:MAG: carboxymuconolactone decarboxylase family protein [Pseudomonadota bacterium]
MSRLTPLTPEELNPEQREVYDAISSGPRGNMGMVGPFGVYVRVPGVGNAVQNLGAAVRYGTALQENAKEVAICTVGAFYHAKFEFAAHAELARKAGVADPIIESLKRGEMPEFTREDEAAAHAVATALLSEHRLDDATYANARDKLGEAELIELVITIGYYTTVSMTLNAFQIPLRDGMADPFPDYD